MEEQETLRTLVTVLAMSFAGLSFLVYLFMSVNWLKPAAQEKAQNSVDEVVGKANLTQAPVSVTEIAELAKAFASLGESLAKAGPALWSLIGSIFFLVIAAVSAGVMQGAPADGSKAEAPAEKPQRPTGGGDAGNRQGNDAVTNENLPVG